MSSDHHATEKAIYHSRVKKMNKMEAVEKPTTPAEVQDPQYRQVNDAGSLSKAEKLGFP